MMEKDIRKDFEETYKTIMSKLTEDEHKELINREKFQEVFGVDISVAASMCNCNEG